MLKKGEDTCDEAYSMDFLNDSELLDLGSTFNHGLSLSTFSLIKTGVVTTWYVQLIRLPTIILNFRGLNSINWLWLLLLI